MIKLHTLPLKGLILLGGIFIFSYNIQAQEQCRHEMGFHLGVGMSTLHYVPPAGAKKTSGGGGMLGFGYTGFFSPQWGITTGLDVAFYSGKLTWDHFSLSYPITPPSGLRGCVILHGDFTNYVEQQYVVFTNIPLMLQFQTTGPNHLFIAAGFKLTLPVYAVYIPSVASLEVTGGANKEYRNRPEYGLDTYNNFKAFGHFDLRATLMASGEIGGKWKLSTNWNMYAGLYADYGLDNARKKVPDKPLILYNPSYPTRPTYYSILQSYSVDDGAFVKKDYPISLGLKLRLTTNFGQLFASSLKNEPSGTQALPSAPPVYNVPNRLPVVTNPPVNSNWRQEASRLKRKVDNYLQTQIHPNPSQQFALEQYAAFLLRNPYLSLTIVGHTCNQGSKDANGRLGLDRAEMAKAYLVQQGVNPQRVQALSRGDLDPLVPNTTEANRRMNRRIELTIHE